MLFAVAISEARTRPRRLISRQIFVDRGARSLSLSSRTTGNLPLITIVEIGNSSEKTKTRVGRWTDGGHSYNKGTLSSDMPESKRRQEEEQGGGLISKLAFNFY